MGKSAYFVQAFSQVRLARIWLPVLMKVAARVRLPWNTADFVRPDGTCTRPPLLLYARPTDVCNLRCRMCAQWGDTGYFREEGALARLKSQELSLDEWKSVFDQAAPGRPLVQLWGGEPLLFKGIDELLVHVVRRRRLKTMMITNGTELDRHAEAVLDSGLEILMVSMDGPEEANDAVRGKGSARRIRRGLAKVLELRNRRGSHVPFVTILATITERTAPEIRNMVALAREMGVDVLNFALPTFVPADRGPGYEALMRERFGVPDPKSWRGFAAPPGENHDIDMAALAADLDWARAQGADGGPLVHLYPNIPSGGVKAWMTDYGETFGHSKCRVPWLDLCVLSNGDVHPCSDFPDLIYGNVRNQTLSQLWNGPAARAFRQRMLGGLMPVCNRCCGLYYYD